MALRASDSGDVRGVFTGPRHFPLLSVGNWLLIDLGQRSAAPELFVFSFLAAVRERAIELDMAEIAEWSAVQSAAELRRLIPDADVVLESLPEAATSEGDDRLLPRWSAGAVASAMAAAALVDADEDAKAGVAAMLRELATAFQLLGDVRNVPQDIVDGRHTLASTIAVRAAGISDDSSAEPYQVLGRLVMTDALAEVDREASSRFVAANESANGLGLPTFVAFTDAAQAAARRRDSSRVARPVGVPAVRPTLSKAIEMAESFLTSDLTFKESWETHREGMLGAELVSSRFPAALILEVLCRRGHQLQDTADAFIEHAEANGFRYYDHPNADPDSDTVGAVLRLLRYSSSPSRRSPELERMLDCLHEITTADAPIPVWLTACSDPNPERPPTFALGEGCGTVVAHLLVGLASLGGAWTVDSRHATQVLLDRVVDVGLGANVNYPPRYALLTYLRLLDAVAVQHPAVETLNAELERTSAEPANSAQDAALAVLAASAGHRPDLVDERWIATILRDQRFDGSWIGEPFAVAPNRGWRATPYSSTTLSTALCYDALALRG